VPVREASANIQLELTDSVARMFSVAKASFTLIAYTFFNCFSFLRHKLHDNSSFSIAHYAVTDRTFGKYTVQALFTLNPQWCNNDALCLAGAMHRETYCKETLDILLDHWVPQATETNLIDRDNPLFIAVSSPSPSFDCVQYLAEKAYSLQNDQLVTILDIAAHSLRESVEESRNNPKAPKENLREKHLIVNFLISNGALLEAYKKGPTPILLNKLLREAGELLN